MKILSFIVLTLVFGASDVFAQAAAQPDTASRFMSMIPMFIMVFFIFYILVLRPQDKKLKEQNALISSLQKSDNVVTSSGIIGRVVAIEEKHITLEVSPNVKIQFEKEYIVKKAG